MSDLKRWFALADHPLARFARSVRRFAFTFSVPAPRLLVRPALAIFIALRECYYFLVRVFVCEPLFKAYCTRYGRGVRTGSHLHWVQGSGKLILGDDVLVDGACSFSFAVRYAPSPELVIGSHTIISHGCTFTVGRRISIGEHCMIAVGVTLFDAPGHPTDPALRKAGAPALPEDVRPIAIGDNVWIGMRATVFPGVTIGEGSVVTAGASVTGDVAPYTIVAGNPARVIGTLAGHPGMPAPDTAPQPGPRPATPARLDTVMELLRRTLNAPTLAPDEDFYDAGLTSIMVLQLIVEIEEAFGLPPSSGNALLNARTGEELAAELARVSEAVAPE